MPELLSPQVVDAIKRLIAKWHESWGYGYPHNATQTGVASDTVTDETTAGLSKSPGSSTDYSRGDHTHGTPAAPAAASSTGLTYRIVPWIVVPQDLQPLPVDVVGLLESKLEDGVTWLKGQMGGEGQFSYQFADTVVYNTGKTKAQISSDYGPATANQWHGLMDEADNQGAIDLYDFTKCHFMFPFGFLDDIGGAEGTSAALSSIAAIDAPFDIPAAAALNGGGFLHMIGYDETAYGLAAKTQDPAEYAAAIVHEILHSLGNGVDYGLRHVDSTDYPNNMMSAAIWDHDAAALSTLDLEAFQVAYLERSPFIVDQIEPLQRPVKIESGDLYGDYQIIRVLADEDNGYITSQFEDNDGVTEVKRIDIASEMLPEVAAPSTPASGWARLYVKTDKKIYLKDDAGTETDLTSAGSGAPTDADYLVGTANGDLSAEIVVGTTPGGELGGTWGSPTVDATHSGSAHHAQAHASDHTNGTDDIQDAAADDSTKGIATFEADDFDSASGKIDLAASVTKSAPTDSGTATPTAHALTIAGGEGIDTSASGATVTIAGEDASDTNKGIVELATIAETDTGTDTGRAVTPDGLQGSVRNLRFIDIRIVAADTDVATGTDLFGDWVVPYACTLTQDDSNPYWFCAWTDTAGTTGTMVVDVNKNGTTVMSTNKLDIETTEKSTGTAATQPDLTTTDLAAGDILTFDVDAIHTTAAKGLVVRLALLLD